MNKLNISNKYIVKMNDYVHNKIELKLLKYLKESKNTLNNKYKYNHHSYNGSNIWVFWYQGYSEMPLIVRKCIKSIKKNRNGHKVVLLTKFNMKHYIRLPRYIIQKVYKNEITLTHLSDIIRSYLLMKYGGLWIDSTIFCVSPINNKAFKGVYTARSKKSKKESHFFVSQERWTGFLLGGNKREPLFTFIYNFFCIYWMHNNKMIDYFLLDYALDYAYKNNIGNFRYYSNIAIHNNNNIHLLENVLNKKFNLKYYEKIKSNTNMFKLTYKKAVNTSNKYSFFSKVVNKV